MLRAYRENSGVARLCVARFTAIASRTQSSNKIRVPCKELNHADFSISGYITGTCIAETPKSRSKEKTSRQSSESHA